MATPTLILMTLAIIAMAIGLGNLGHAIKIALGSNTSIFEEIAFFGISSASISIAIYLIAIAAALP